MCIEVMAYLSRLGQSSQAVVIRASVFECCLLVDTKSVSVICNEENQLESFVTHPRCMQYLFFIIVWVVRVASPVYSPNRDLSRPPVASRSNPNCDVVPVGPEVFQPLSLSPV